MSWWNPFTKKPQPTAEQACEMLANKLACQYPDQVVYSIKLFREQTGCGLKEAKQAIDAARARRGFPEWNVQQPQTIGDLIKGKMDNERNN